VRQNSEEERIEDILEESEEGQRLRYSYIYIQRFILASKSSLVRKMLHWDALRKLRDIFAVCG
jgi:hypothetical protein